MEKNKLLDIDFLKKNNTRMYYFGLGFIQLVLNQEERIHFYNEQLEQTNDEIHNHRYNFTSTILKGHFLESRYKLVEGSSHILTNESCGKDKVLTNEINIEVGIETKFMPNFNSIMNYYEGDSYNIFFNEFHSVSYIGNTITHLKRSPIITEFAQVLQPKDSDKVCPFAAKYSDEVLWEVIEDTINN